MFKYIILVGLALLTMMGSVAEGLFQALPAPLVQANGLLIIISAMVVVILILKKASEDFKTKN
jgi:hypothetical protein